MAACSSRDETEIWCGRSGYRKRRREHDDGARARANAAPSAAPKAELSKVLPLESLDGLAIGQPAPADSSFAPRGAQVPGGCTTVSSPDYPGVYAIVEGEQVRRITVGERSDVKLAEGVGVGATESEVLTAFPGFRSEPHKYVSAPAKYLTQRVTTRACASSLERMAGSA